jgi:NAD-dependent deacetylase
MSKFITVFTGAGISACSGVQTFRDANGLWEGHKVEQVASVRGFVQDPQLVWDFYRARYEQLKEVQPNAGHEALVKLEEFAKSKGYEFLLITQNIDGLHHRAGSQNVVELHGELRTLKCFHEEDCGFTTSDESFWNETSVPKCPVCGANLRVNVTWFGEMLPEQAFIDAERAAKNSAVMLVVGTSGVVQPAASLVEIASAYHAKIVECNPVPAFYNLSYGFDPSMYRCLRGKASVVVPAAVQEIRAKYE